MENVLQTEELTKTYKGVHVVDHVSLTVRQGDIYGFVGKKRRRKNHFYPHGAGADKALRRQLPFF